MRRWGKQGDFAEGAGVGRTTLHRIFAGMDPGDAQLDKFAQILHLPIAAILEGGEATTSPVVEIPVYDVEVAAGAGRSVDARLRAPLFHWAFPKAWAEANLGDVGSLKMFRVVGDSQEPELSEDDLVAVDMRSTKLREGMYVVRLDDLLVVKRVQLDGNGTARLVSRNPDYSDVVIDLKEARHNDGAGSFEIIGRAVWASKML